MSIWIYPYGVSNSARDLAEVCDGNIIRRERSRYRYRRSHLVVNWGCSTRPRHLVGVPVLNDFRKVAIATSKIATFQRLAGANVNVPSFTTDRAVAQTWRGRTLGRDLDSGRSGRGITVYDSGRNAGNHRFYTKYCKKEREFRVHVFKGAVIFEQEKLKKRDAERNGADKYIRSHDRGWVFGFHHLTDNPVPQTVRDAALGAVECLGLDFGAVDIGWHGRNGVVVFEVNTAPGIENTSLQAYARAIQECRV